MQVKILLWFDVEDYATPESDDAFYALLKMMDEVGVRSAIKFCAKKLRLLQERGRTDILSLLAGHEAAFHTTDHSVHPLPSEYLDNYNFKNGAAEFERRERGGFSDVREIAGQAPTSYGQPGEAWAPQVFPVLKKWGIPTYLDAHPIIGTGGSPFWYGGVLCLTKLDNLVHMKHDETALSQLKSDFDGMKRAGADTVFFSIYDHPTELCCETFWDEVNFLKGRNPDVLRPAPLRAAGEMEQYVDVLRKFIAYTLQSDDVEYCTASETPRYEYARKAPISAEELRRYAQGFDANVSYAMIGGAYLSAQELFSLSSRLLTGRALIPEFMYGPEKFETSIVRDDAVSARELARAAYGQSDRTLGYKQMRSLYRIGENFLNPVDMACTMFEAIKTGEDMVAVKRGRFAAADHVDETYRFGGNWALWKDSFEGKRIVEHTKLQAWTLKPAIF